MIILLAVAIRKFYSDTTPSTKKNALQTEIFNIIDIDSSGNRIFKDSNALSGIADNSDRIIVNPEWYELEFANGNLCIARQYIGEKLMTGCINYDGDIKIPFIYNNIELYNYDGFTFYIAVSNDNSCVVYDEKFNPYFRKAWKGYNISDNEIIFNSDNAIYTYAVDKDGFRLKSAEIIGKTLDRNYILNVSSRILLSKLSVSMLEKISDMTGKYIEYAYTGNDSLLEEITTNSRSGFIQMFPEDHKILSKKLINISEIFLYSVRSDDDVPHYAVSITANTEIEYSDETSGKNIIRDNYTAIIEFSGYSESDLTAISGKFDLDEPKYPQPEESQNIFINEQENINS